MARMKITADVVSHLRDALSTEVLSLVASDEDAGRAYKAQTTLGQYQKARLQLLQYVEERKAKK